MAKALVTIFCMVAMSMVSANDGALEPRPAKYAPPGFGMNLLFDIQNGLLNNLIQTKTVGNFIEQFNVTSFEYFRSEDFVNRWDEWTLYVIGYLVCISLGLLLAFILPFTGCCVGCFRNCKCCARCCKCGCCSCCKPRLSRQNKKWKYRRNCYSVGVGFMTAILLASVACSFVATQQLKQQIEPFGFLETVLQSINNIDQYIATAVVEVDQSIIGQVDLTTGSLKKLLADFPQLLTADLGERTGMLPDLKDLETYVNNLPYMHGNLSSMESAANDLPVKANNLETLLKANRNNLKGPLTHCISYPECHSANASLHLLTIGTDFTGMDPVTAPKNKINDAITDDIIQKANDDVSKFWAIGNGIDVVLNDSLRSVIGGINDFDIQVKDAMHDIKDLLQGVNFTNLKSDVSEFKPTFHEYGSYAYWGFLGIACLCTLIVLCYFLGLILGLCLPAPPEKPNCCASTSKQGSKCLLAGAGITFGFSWLLLIITIAIFAAGGIIETNLCRHILTLDSSMDKLEVLAMKELQKGSNFSISLKQVALDCQANRSLYVATNIENNGLNISDVVDLEQYGIFKLLDDISNFTIEPIPATGLSPILSGDVITGLTDIDNSLKTVDFTTYEDVLVKDITLIDLPSYISTLTDIVTVLSPNGHPSAAPIQAELDALTDTYNTIYKDIESDRDILQLSYNNVDQMMAVFDVGPGLTALAAAEIDLNNFGNDKIKLSQKSLTDNMANIMQNFSDGVEGTVRNDLGSCRSLFDAGAILVDGACLYMLNPVNALWFCLGWFLIFSVFAVAFANELAFILSAPAAVGETKRNQTAPVIIDDQELPPPYTIFDGNQQFSSRALIPPIPNDPYKKTVIGSSSKPKRTSTVHPYGEPFSVKKPLISSANSKAKVVPYDEELIKN